MAGWGRQALGATVLLLASAAIISVTLLESSNSPSSLLSKDGAPLSDKKELLSKLRGLLKDKVDKQHQIGSQVKAWVAASSMKATEPAAHKVALAQNWKNLRSDWQPYNPSLSLSENMAKSQQTGDAREQQLSEQSFVKRVAKPSVSAKHSLSHGKNIVRYESHYHAAGGPGGYDGKNGCSNWGEHPLACIRQQYHNHLRATKFASLRRKYDGKVTRDALDHERNVIANKVSEGLVTGKLAVPKHGPVKQWVKQQERAIHAQRQEELKAQVRKEAEAEAKEEALHDVARDWGSGVAASGPDAGRRYYVNYATGKTSFSAPAYVAQALSQLRKEKAAEEKSKVERDAALYKEGFQAAERADVTGTAGFAPLHPPMEITGARRAEQEHASMAINRFLTHHGRSIKPNAYTTNDLAHERKKVAHELGLKSLTHGGSYAPAATQQLSNLPVPMTDSDSSNLVIVDPYGRPITAAPSSSQYPGMEGFDSGSSAQPKEEPAAEESEKVAEAKEEAAKEAGAKEEAREGATEDSKVEAAIAKVARASQEHEAALQAEVRAQEAIIKDLEAKVNTVSARKARAPREEAAAAPAGEEAEERSGVEDAKPALGSWEMAKFANNVDSGLGGLGTNIVHMYDDLSPTGPYKEVADGKEADSDRNFAVDREEVEQEEAERVQDDLKKVRAEAEVFGGKQAEQHVARQLGRAMSKQAANVNLGTIGSVSPVPITGEAGDEIAPRYQVKAERAVAAAPKAVAQPAQEKAKDAEEREEEHKVEAEEAEEAGVLPPPSKAEEAEEEEEGDEKPALGSWDMAKFANNVESGGGSLGTNVVWMYDNLAKRGPYHAVEAGLVDDDAADDEADEYRAVPTSVLKSIQAPIAAGRLEKVADRTYAKIEGGMGDAPQQI